MIEGRRWVIAAGLAVGLPLLAMAALTAAFVAGARIDLTRWSDLAARQASAALGRPVVLPGTLRLTLGRELKLRVGGVRVMGPAGAGAAPLLTLGDTTLALDLADLPDLLRGAPRLQRVDADDVALWLERAADGRGNWASPPASATPATPAEPGAAGTEVHIGQLRLNGVVVRYVDEHSATRREFAFESVVGGMGSTGAVFLHLHGLVDARPAYRVKLDGGGLNLLKGGAEPWPFSVSLQANGTSLDARGTLDAGIGEARFDFGAMVDDPSRAGRLWGLALPALGRLSLHGSAMVRPDTVELTRLQGTLPGADVEGQLALQFGGPRARLTGVLQVGELDHRPAGDAFAGAQHDEAERGGRSWQDFALRTLTSFDAELELQVGRWSGLPVDVSELRLRWSADERGLRLPITAMVAGSAASGRIDLDTASPTPALALQFDAGRLSVSQLAGDAAAEWAGEQGFDATVERTRVHLDGRGETLAAWLRDLQGSVEVAGLDLNHGARLGAQPIALRLDRLTLLAAPGKPLIGRASGSLQGERIAVQLQAGRLPDMLDGRSLPIDLELSAAPATLRVVLDPAAWRTGPERDLGFDFRARRSGELARWLGVAPASTLPVALSGRLRWSDQRWQLDSTALRLGRSQAAVRASAPRHGSGEVTTAEVRMALLDVPELSTLRAAVTPGPSQERAAPAMPFELADADLRLDLQHLKLARTELRDIGLSARIRKGRWLPAPVTGRLANTQFDGEFELDRQGDESTARLELSARQVDVGELLTKLGAAEAIFEGRADALQFSVDARGRNLAEMMQRTGVRAQLRGGNLAWLSAPQRPLAEIRLREAGVDLWPGEPLRARLDGTVGSTPVQIEISTGTLAELLRDTDRLPFAMAARGAGTLLTLDGDVALPLGRNADLRLQISGKRLDSLNELSHVELPAWGPWSLAGAVRLTPSGYEVPDLQLRVGQSRLGGSGRLDLGGPRPHLALRVSAPSAQLDDFPLPARLSDPAPREPPVDAVRSAAGTLAERTDRLLSARFLRRFDADVDVQVDELLAGADRLADARIRVKLHEGRLNLDPVVVNLPGGSLRMSLAYDLKEPEIDFAMSAAIERFDYGVIARRLGRGDNMQGLFSMKVQLQGRAPSLDTMLLGAHGALDIAVWPRELRSGVFNLWTVNLVLNVLPLIDSGSSTGVNCVIGRFDLKDGIVTDDALLIDTTSVRIRGAGQANLRTEALDFVFRPRAKGFAVFRLQNPLRVTGTLFDQRIGLNRRDLPESILRLIGSPILWPIEQLTLGPLPRDGADVCADPLRALAK
jgi:uncharacterized protein involved in outer membrane biogenesis